MQAYFKKKLAKSFFNKSIEPLLTFRLLCIGCATLLEIAAPSVFPKCRALGCSRALRH